MAFHSANRSIIITFDISAAFVSILLLLLIFTASFSTKVTRRGSWFNFIVPTALYPAVYLLQLGKQGHTQPPLNSLCISQALLIYAFPIYAITGFTCFMWESYLFFSSTFLNTGSNPTSIKASKIILLIPPFTFLVVLIAEIMLVLLHHEIRKTIGFNVGRIYCHASHRILMLFMAATCLSLFCAWFYIYGTIIMLLKKRWPVLATCEAWRRKLLIHSAIRITVMTVAVCIGIIVCIFAIVIPAENEQPASAFQYLALPLAVFLLFGTQTDILRCWACGGSRSAKVSNS